MKLDRALLLSSFTLLSACSSTKALITPTLPLSEKHIQSKDAAATLASGEIPQASLRTIALPPPKPSAKVEVMDFQVSNLDVREALLALAQDAKINIDIHPDIRDTRITMTAINQTLMQILNRIAKQVEIRYEFHDGIVSVMPDKAFLKTYKIDFINMARTAKSTDVTSSQITGSTGTGTVGSGNTASTTVTSDTKNDLMDSLIKNVGDMLLEEDRLRFNSLKEVASASRVSAQGEGNADVNTGSSPGKAKQTGSEPSATGGASGSGNQNVQASGGAIAKTAIFEKSVSVFANKETGVLIVRATSRQHEKVQEFIDTVMRSAKRQAMIEATIVEVTLSSQYQQGINWSQVFTGPQGLTLTQAANTNFAITTGAFSINANPATSVNLLQTFGTVKVLSSPKLTVMNNQTASLKVATNNVYFTITTTAATTTNGVTTPGTYSSTPNSVSVGLTMSVTPQISDNDTVTLNVRPSISSIVGLGVNDPNPILANPCGVGVSNCNIAAIKNTIPVIQTREMESIIKIENGQTAVMGGLIREELNKNNSEIPLLGRIPFFGNLFRNRNDTTTKTELVIFLRPVVIKEPDVNGDYAQFKSSLPDATFFNTTAADSMSLEKQKP
jgi:general secretion pathway protein D